MVASSVMAPTDLAQSPVAPSAIAAPALADTTVLVIRHAEKPESGTDLTPAGVARAAAYPHFFDTLRIEGKPVHVDYIFATADSKGSHRERLTMEPLAKALHETIDLRFKNKEFADLAETLKTKSYGKTVLICWHHGKIPDLLAALGANPTQLLPEGKWPAATFNWLVELHYGHAGRLATEKVLKP